MECQQSNDTVDFESNGYESRRFATTEHSYLIHEDYTQSTPTANGQFKVLYYPEIFYNSYMEKSAALGMKLNPNKTKKIVYIKRG